MVLIHPAKILDKHICPVTQKSWTLHYIVSKRRDKNDYEKIEYENFNTENSLYRQQGMFYQMYSKNLFYYDYNALTLVWQE